MHGSIFVLLQKFVESKFDKATWKKLLQQSNVSNHAYEMNGVYPDEEIMNIVSHATALTGLSVSALHEAFGIFLVPDLMKVYKDYIRPEWKTFEVLEHTESSMHAAARSENTKANPPVLNVNRVNPNLIIIDYFSKRRMGGLAMGITKGIAAYYGEADQIKVTATTEIGAERMQIRVERITEPGEPATA